MRNKLGDYFKSQKAKEEFLGFYEMEQEKWTIPLRSGYAETHSGKTYYLESGWENRETLLYIHGNGESAHSARAFHEYFSRQYRVISLDAMWQIGRSVPWVPMNKKEGYNPWLLEVLDHFSIDKVILTGFSYGSWISLDFALRHPERIQKLILISPAASFQPIHRAYFGKIYRLALFPNRRNMLACLQFWYGPGNPVSQYAKDQMEMQFRLCKLKPPPLAPRVFRDEELQSLDVPLLLIMGSQEGTTDPVKSLARAERLVKNARTLSVEGGSHYLDVTHREIMQRGIEGFLREP